MDQLRPPSVYDVRAGAGTAHRQAKWTSDDSTRLRIQIAEALGHRDVDVVQTALEKALADGYIAEHPEYHGMYYMTETGEGLMDTAALNG